MICPKCANEMKPVTFEGVEVDRCTGCQGLWFDAREQERLKDMKGSDVIDQGKPVKGAGRTSLDTVRKINCPVCHTPMIGMVDPQQPHLQFESCKVCFGVFFDAGEFRDYKHKSLLESIKTIWRRMRE